MIYKFLRAALEDPNTIEEAHNLNEGNRKASVQGPPISLRNLLGLYDYLYTHGYSAELGSSHNATARTDMVSDSARGDVIKGNQGVQNAEAALTSVLGADDTKWYPYSVNGNHLYYGLVVNSTSKDAVATIYFANLHINELSNLKESIKNFYTLSGLADENTAEDYVNVWQPDSIRWANGRSWTGGAHVILPFTISDSSGSIPNAFKEFYKKVKKF